MPIEVQREAVRGYDRALEMYGDIPPSRLKGGETRSNIYATYNPVTRMITYNGRKRDAASQAFRTSVHEMTHHASNIGAFDSNNVLHQAWKQLEIRSNSREAMDYITRTVGIMNHAACASAEEIVAYAMERQASSNNNKLTEAIASLIGRR